MANPYAPPRAVVADVVRTAGVVRADPGTRLGAALLDGVIAVAMTGLPMGVLLALTVGIGRPVREENGTEILALVAVLTAFVGMIVWLTLTFKFVKANGQTIAKKIVGIKVIRTDGSPASLGRIFWLRNVVNALLGVIPLYNMIEVLFIFGDARQCLHDKIADTIVVRA